MIREVSLEEISDGRLYGSNDMVKADCGDCKGCSACCRSMGDSIVLDPLDVFRLSEGLHQTFEQLLAGGVALHVECGIILPNLKMAGEAECCSYLDETGRCSIHGFRPGICRLFPLGRYYEGNTFRYFLQVHECRNQNCTKVKVRKWIDTPELVQYERFVCDWHYFLKDLQQSLQTVDRGKEGDGTGFSEQRAKELSMYVLKLFYMVPFEKNISFYVQFAERLAQARDVCGLE